MDRETVKKHLLEDNCVSVHVWTFSASSMSCGDYIEGYGYCCSDSYENVEEALDSIYSYANNDWDEVELL